MGLVIDASAIVAWLLDEGEERERVKKSLGDDLVVPCVWQDEVANALVNAERRGRITAEARARFAAQVATLDVTLCVSPGVPRIAQLAAVTGLTTYDAEYLHAATEHGVAILTFDRQLADAARRAGVPVL